MIKKYHVGGNIVTINTITKVWMIDERNSDDVKIISPGLHRLIEDNLEDICKS